MILFGGNEESADSFGDNRLAEKMSALEEDKNSSIDRDRAIQLSKELAAELSKELKNASSVFAASIVPGFIRRFQNQKVHHQLALDLEVNHQSYHTNVISAIKVNKKHRKNELRRKNVLKARNMASSILGSEAKKEIEYAEAQKDGEAKQAYIDRRSEQLQQVQREIDMQMAERLKSIQFDVLEKRRSNLTYWTQQAEAEHKNSIELNHRKVKFKRDGTDESLILSYFDWQNRDLTRSKLQLNSSDHDSTSIGFISKNYSICKNIQNSHSGILIEDEIEDTLNVLESAKGEQILNFAIQNDIQVCNNAIEILTTLISVKTRDKYQIMNEFDESSEQLLGPPKRLPTPQEVFPAHMRKEKLKNLNNAIANLEHCRNVAIMRREELINQISGSEKNHISELSQTEQTNQLPVIIGRNISKCFGISEIISNSLETFNSIKQRSRLKIIQNDVQLALQSHQERVTLNQQLWISNQNNKEVVAEANFIVNRVANVTKRLKASSLENAKLGIIEAIAIFQFKNIQLRHIAKNESGFIPWYLLTDINMSNNCIAHRRRSLMGDLLFDVDDQLQSIDGILSKGVTLSPDEKSGFCCGIMHLPEIALWCILLTVSIEGHIHDELNGSSECVKILLGVSLENMVEVGSYFNTINPETGSVLYDITYFISGDMVAFRFEFSSLLGLAGSNHMTVGVGFFEKYEMKPLEYFTDSSGQERILSSFVKIIRMDERQGKFRETNLLEELIALENSESHFWDSDVIFHTPQRFSPEYYLRILKAEILFVQKLGKITLNEKQSKLRSANISSLQKKCIIDKQLKLEQSKTDFLIRKHFKQTSIIDEGNQLINRRLEIFDPSRGNWRHVLVKSCIVNWLDNGLTAKCTHLLHEHNEGNEVIGVEFEADVTKIQWFVSAIQDNDDIALERWRNQRKYEVRMEEIASIMDRNIYQVRIAYEEYRDGEKSALRKRVAKMSKMLNSNIQLLGQLRAEEPDAQRIIKQGISTVLLEMKMGLIQMNPLITPGVQAFNISKTRFIDKWITDKRQHTSDELFELERIAEHRINERRVKFMRLELEIANEANKERHSLISQIREYKAQERRRIMEKVRIDPNILSRVLPQARKCAHLKTKAWGMKYSKGLKCLSCGIELSSIDSEESQTLGYGTGADNWMYEAIKRHRENESSFKFKFAQELHIVEKERLFLEKERREMEESQSQFYDFQDLTAVYEFDYRHAKAIKTEGCFRQGLQWKEHELRYFEKQMVQKERDRIQKANLVENLIDKYDPLSIIQDPPPTFRAADERRKAQHTEYIFVIGRLHTYQKRVATLKEYRLKLISDRRIFSSISERLHKNSYCFDVEIGGIEEDLDKTGLLLTTYNRMQVLWRQATRIMIQSDKDMRRAEMRHLGVWEDVAQSRDILTFIHHETLELLKIQHLIDTTIASKNVNLETENVLLTEMCSKLEKLESNVSFLEYCQPGNPMMISFGFGWIREYRERDQMLFVTVGASNFVIKFWVRVQDWIDVESSRQTGERILMDIEGQRSSIASKQEIQLASYENIGMQRAEQGLKDYYTFIHLGDMQEKVVSEGIDKSVQEKFSILETKNFKQSQEFILSRRVQVWKDAARAFYSAYSGPAAGRPPKVTMWSVYKYKELTSRELKIRFLSDAARETDKITFNSYNVVRKQWIQKHILTHLMDSVVLDWLTELSYEAIHDGMIAKDFAEKLSGIAFPKTTQFDIFRSLLSIWKQRKFDLQTKIDISLVKTKKPSLCDSNILKEKKRMSVLEKKRQRSIIRITRDEENSTKIFYQWELKENLRERREMSGAEKIARSVYLLQKARIEKTAPCSQLDEGLAENVATIDERRAQLKSLAIERRKQSEDQALMILEDRDGESMREIDRVERIRGFNIDCDKSLDDISLSPIGNMCLFETPEWMTNTLPSAWEGWNVAQQKAFLDGKSMIHQRSMAIEENFGIEIKKIKGFEEQSYLRWQIIHSPILLHQREMELVVMKLVEDTRQFHFDLASARMNIQKISTFCREKGTEELMSERVVYRKVILARKREMEMFGATSWFNLCSKRVKLRDKLKRRVISNCLWIDSDSISGFQQRFQTYLLRERLYWVYFQRIASQIIERAEIVASERRLMTLQEQLSLNKRNLLERTHQMKDRWKEIQRDEYMRMRKSLLNVYFFPKHRRETLQLRFSSWIRFFLWNRGLREAFTLRFEMLKIEMNIQRQFKSKNMSDSDLFDPKKPLLPVRNNSEHLIKCLSCCQFYLQSQNHSLACFFHPGIIAMDCPADCPAPNLTAMCQSHRIRRWKCCSSIKADSVGCSRKFHIPFPNDPVYETIITKINQRDAQDRFKLDEMLNDVEENWPLKLMETKRGHVSQIEEVRNNKREQANAYFTIKFA